ncbi:MAG: response regulator [Nitrosopumilaceae archaeon]|nr:response regulator [Nitrosopumilaceae archaeon]
MKESPEIESMDEPITTNNNFEIMLVDDDENTIEVFSEYLELIGHNVVGKAFDGKQAFELYKTLTPDFVFMDVMMPEYDGFYGLEKIKSYDENAVVIAVTADLTNETEQKLKKLKSDAIIYKPFDMESIITIMEKIHKRKQSSKNSSM